MGFRDRLGRPVVDRFTTIDRRHVLAGLSALGVAGLVEGASAPRLWAQPVFATTPFALGVASGEPAADGFVAWTRLGPRPLEPRGGMPARAIEVEWIVARDEKLAAVVRSGKAVARPELGHALHVEVSGLEPGRHYFYAFRVAGHQSRVGRARTLPTPGAGVARARFAVAGCQRYDDGYFTAWRHLAGEDVDFVFHYGDYIYENGNRIARERERKVVRPLPGGQDEEAYSLDDYRRRYAAYQLDPDLQAAQAAHTFVTSFDDHEVDNNWAGADSVERGVDQTLFHLRRTAAFQAWYESMPLRRASLPRNGAILAYRRFAIGDLAAVDVLDTRQYRSAHACGGGWKAECAAASGPEQKIIGDEQERWILNGFREGNARWTVLAQQVIMMQRMRVRPNQTADFSMDKWDGATQTRRRLLDAALATKKNLVVVSGDLHDAIAGTLKADFNAAGSPAAGVELVATSISSDGDGVELSAAGKRLLAHNPHLKFWNGRRGYLINTLTHARWEADFRLVAYVEKRGAPVETKRRFVVEAGKPELQNS